MIFRKMWFYIKWVGVYFLFAKERQAYSMAQSRGMYCYGVRNGIAKYDPNRPPQGIGFITFSDYKKMQYPVKKGSV